MITQWISLIYNDYSELDMNEREKLNGHTTNKYAVHTTTIVNIFLVISIIFCVTLITVGM